MCVCKTLTYGTVVKGYFEGTRTTACAVCISSRLRLCLAMFLWTIPDIQYNLATPTFSYMYFPCDSAGPYHCVKKEVIGMHGS